jgi:2-iminoacetate synthase ThiH
MIEEFGASIAKINPEYYKEIVGMAGALGIDSNGLLMA